jgi:GTPase SAR1 family protein
MALKVAIVGLPNVGKSTLFNAQTQTAQAANYPFCTIEPNIGDVAVPEARLEALARIAGSEEIIQARVNFVDEGWAAEGSDLSEQAIARAKRDNADAVVISAKIESGDRPAGRGGTWRVPRILRAREAGPQPADPSSPPPARPADLFHRGARGGARRRQDAA